jgi:hypothetical protein
MAATEKLPPSEYGGSDTRKTMGIQPAPHVLTAEEKLRLMYHEDPMEETTIPLPGLTPLT